MSRPARQSLRRLAQFSLAAIVGIVGLPILSSGGNVAQAVETAQCKPEANVFVGMANSDDFRLRKNTEPASGWNQWSSDAGIGWGWNNRFMAGPNGYLWFIELNGELRRHRWNGSGWDNGGVSELIATDWQGWNNPTYRYRVTVDVNNIIYTVDSSGSLKQYKYDEATKQLTGKVIEAGWGKYDQIFAAGDGVLYARDRAVQDGTLYRYQYDFRTDTWKQREKNVGWGWNGYKQMSSPGADIVYGTYPGGETWWYRYLPEQDFWQNNGSGDWKSQISTWGNVDEIAPAIDSCGYGQLASEVDCVRTAPIWGAQTDNGLYRRQHNEPETGLTSWEKPEHLGNGWNGTRFMAGAGGYKFIIRPDGEVHRHRWNGSGWDNGGVSKRIATGWGGWDDPRYHNRVTVDSNNHFYAALATGQLERSVYNEAADTWTKEIIDDGWGRFDQVLAAGDGVLYARDPNVNDGALFRFHYDWKNRRWIDYMRPAGTGWNGYQQIVSPGGDVIYGRAGFDIWWYRWDNTKKDFAPGAEGVWKEYIAWWQNLTEIMVDVDACKLKNPETITPPQTPAPSDDKAKMIYNQTHSRFEVAFTDANGTLHRGWQTIPGAEVMSFQGLSSTGFTGRATLAQRDDNRLVVMAQGTNSQVKSYLQKASGDDHWNTAVGVNGALNSAPVLARGTNKVLTAFAVDGDNKLWFSEQFGVDGEFKPWRKATYTGDYNMTGDMTVLPSGDGFEIAYRNPTGTLAVKRFVNGALLGTRAAGGITGVGTPGAVVFADGKVQLVTRASNDKLYTQKEGASGFTAWADISGAATFAGSPTAVLNNYGIVEVAARLANGDVVRGGQTAPGALSWRVWDNTTWNTSIDVSFASSTGNEQRIFVRTPDGQYLLIDSPPYTSNQAAALPAHAAESQSLSTKSAPAKATKRSIK